MFECVALALCHRLYSRLSHSVSVTGSTGLPEAERPQGRKQPAQVKRGGKLEPTRRPRREARVARPGLNCSKPVCCVTDHRIPSGRRRLSGNKPGSSGLPTVERHGGPEHAGKAEAGEVGEPNAPQDPRGMVKAGLLETNPDRDTGSPIANNPADETRCHRLSLPLGLVTTSPCGEIPGNEPGRRDEWWPNPR